MASGEIDVFDRLHPFPVLLHIEIGQPLHRVCRPAG
jgi:hypothetical protein